MLFFEELWDEFPNPLKKFDFGITAILELRINKNKPSVVDINPPNYGYEFCPTESLTSSTRLYVRNHFSNKLRKDLSILKSY